GAVIAHEDRPVVGNKLGEQRDEKEGEKDPQRPEATPVTAERLKPPPSERSDTEAEKAVGEARRRVRLGSRAVGFRRPFRLILAPRPLTLPPRRSLTRLARRGEGRREGRLAVYDWRTCAVVRRSGSTFERVPRRPPRCSFTRISAIWTALSAAPLRRLSATTHMFSP